MSIGGLLVGGIILLITLAWIGSPFLKRRSHLKNEDVLREKHRERLLMVYERVLTNIRDLDEDQATGKMQLGDYQQEREGWVQRGIDVLKALDDIEATSVITPADGNDDQAIDSQIEEAIAAYRAKRV